MDKHLASLDSAVFKPILKQLSEPLILPNLTRFYLLSAASISLIRNSGLCPNNHQSYGLFHITEDQHQTLWDKQLVRSPDKASLIRGLASQHQFLQTPHHELIINLNYATAIAAFALSLHPKIQQTTLSLHQQIALLNEVFPGFKGVHRKEWQQAQTRLSQEQDTEHLLSSTQNKEKAQSIAACA